MIFVRSRRPILYLALATAVTAVALLAAAALALSTGNPPLASMLLLGALLAGAFVARAGLRLRRWPGAVIGFFRDGLVVRTGRLEVLAHWDDMELVTLAAPSEWTQVRWPELALTDRLTIRMRRGLRFRLHPATFGLDPVACRDLVLRLRDDASARGALPEFDSSLDLRRRPAAVGELMKPSL